MSHPHGRVRAGRAGEQPWTAAEQPWMAAEQPWMAAEQPCTAAEQLAGSNFWKEKLSNNFFYNPKNDCKTNIALFLYGNFSTQI